MSNEKNGLEAMGMFNNFDDIIRSYPNISPVHKDCFLMFIFVYT